MMNYQIPNSVLQAIRSKYLVRPSLLQKASRILAEDRLRPSSSSDNWIVKSNTKDHVEYIITPDAEKCGCESNPNILCSHRLAVLIRLEMFNQTKVEAITTGQPRAELRVDVISQREAHMRAVQDMRKKTEWLEEGLD